MSQTPKWVRDAREGTRSGGPAMRAKQPGSPYFDVPASEWGAVTRELLAEQPLDGPTLVAAVLGSWDDIFASNLGPARIGVDIKPSPQIMGSFLHELIPLRLALASPDWRREANAGEKDLIYLPDDDYSVEIKTSSHPTQIFGNRSFGIDNPRRDRAAKVKAGYYAAVNFGKWSGQQSPRILRVRYGWLDETDWVAQTSETGQQSALPALVDNTQLLLLYP
jgi:hypothetical protein